MLQEFLNWDIGIVVGRRYMQKEFEKVFTEIFEPSYFGKLIVPKLSPVMFKNIPRFVEGIIQGKSKIFYKDNLWNLLYYFMGEMYSDHRDVAIFESKYLKFNKKTNEVWFDEEVLFSLIVLMKRQLVLRLGTLKDTGLKRWVKDEDYLGFLKSYRSVLKWDHLRKGIMHGRPTDVKYFRSQDEILQYLKGSVGKKKIQEVIEICKARSYGPWVRLKENSQEGLVKKAEALYNQIRNTVSERDFKKQRITKTKSVRYVLYLALLGTIQTRVNEPLSISSKKESRLFTYYYSFRNASAALGYFNLVDESFAPGIRCKSYVTKIMCKNFDLKKIEPILMNKIEKRFLEVEELQKREFASKFGYNAYEYLVARAKMKFLDNEVKYAMNRNKSIGCAIYKFGNKNGSLWKQRQYAMINHNKAKQSVFYYALLDFKVKWSDPRIYNWMMYEGRVA